MAWMSGSLGPFGPDFEQASMRTVRWTCTYQRLMKRQERRGAC